MIYVSDVKQGEANLNSREWCRGKGGANQKRKVRPTDICFIELLA